MTDDLQNELGLPSGVRSALRAAGNRNDGSHIDPVDLAEYLDGALDAEAHDALEAHLAICAPCREVMANAAGLAEAVLAEDGAEPVPGPAAANDLVPAAVPKRGASERTTWLALAALVVVALGLAWTQLRGPRGGESLAALGITPEIAAGVEPGLLRAAARVASGEWPGGVDLDSFGTPGGPAVLRTGDVADGPEPLVPRWSAVDDPRPVFRWRWLGEEIPDRVEVLVVNLEEKPVVFLEVEMSDTADMGSDGAGRWSARVPSSSPALKRGEAYAWKVNVQQAGEWLASAYVPFKVLREEASARLADELAAAGDVAFLRAVVLASHGLDAPALEALAEIPTPSPERTALARDLLARKRLSTDAVRAELARLDTP